jgi:CBS domain-containing protein
MMITIRDLLKIKGNQVWTITLNTTVLDTLKIMDEKDVGALLVLDNGQIAGIVSERDFARSIARSERCVLNTTVLEYMTKNVITVQPDQSIDDCLKLMTDKHFRHLPVVEDNKLIGLISIGDVVKEIISSRETTIGSLEDYIQGRGYGH